MTKKTSSLLFFSAFILLPQLSFAQQKPCNIGSLPSISFSKNSVSLSNDFKAILSGVSKVIRNNPNCKVAVVGYGENSKSVQQFSWDRVNTVINYLVEKEGISPNRFIFIYGEPNGDANTVDIREAGINETSNSVPAAPHSDLSPISLENLGKKNNNEKPDKSNTPRKTRSKKF